MKIERLTQFFQTQIDQLAKEEQVDGRQYLLSMYANPVVNANQGND